MTDVFDGLPEIFTDVLGEAVDLTPIATGVAKRIRAIWTETSGGLDPSIGLPADLPTTTLSVRAADIVPIEDDTATRVSDGKVMVVTTPILPDGKGMIVCNLAPV